MSSEMHKARIIFLFGLVPAFALAGVVLLIGAAVSPPRFMARAVIAVDWNLMPSVPNDEKATEVRTEWRKRIVGELLRLPKSDTEIAHFLKWANALSRDQNKNSAVVSAVKKGLRIALLKQTAERDEFSIEVQNNDTNFAQTAVQSVLRGIISKINTKATIAGLIAGGRSYENVEDAILRREALREERRRLQDPNSSLPRQASRQRLQEIDSELAKLEWEHMEAGLGAIVNFVGAFSTDAVKVVEKVHTEARGNQYGLGFIFTAAILGCAAGIVGLTSHRFASVKPIAPRTIPSVPPMVTTPPPILPRPPLIAPSQRLTPPVLPPSIPVQPRR